MGCQKMAGPFRSSGPLETNWAAPFPKFYMFIASDDICETIGKPQQATGNCVTGEADLTVIPHRFGIPEIWICMNERGRDGANSEWVFLNSVVGAVQCQRAATGTARLEIGAIEANR